MAFSNRENIESNATDPIDAGKPADTTVVIGSKNRKLASRKPNGPQISTTSRTAATCAPDCPFVQSGDHADSDGVPICYANERTNRPSIFQLVAKSSNAMSVGRVMKHLANNAAPGSAVRHLVSGDVLGEGDDYVEAANELHAARQDLQGWGYTHNWRRMTSEAAKGWVLNASTETPGEAAEAIRRGWQAVIESPAEHSLAGTRIAGRRVVTCPNQLHHAIGCADCHLCRSNSPTRPIVEFIAHGSSGAIRKEIENRIMSARAAEESGNQSITGLTDHFKAGTSNE